MISCSEAISRLWAYLDGTVGDADREAIEEHLGICLQCCGELEFAEELRRLLRESAHPELPDDVRERLHATLSELGRS